MERVRVGVIGTGGSSGRCTCPSCRATVDAWCADADGAVAQGAAARFGVPHAGTDYRASCASTP